MNPRIDDWRGKRVWLIGASTGIGAALAAIMQRFGGIDLVVYLAGDYQPMRATDFDLARAEAIVAVNFNGALKLAAAVLPHLEPGAGIAFVASIAGWRGLPKALAYGPGKAALIHFAECLHLELAPRGIGVWIISPRG